MYGWVSSSNLNTPICVKLHASMCNCKKSKFFHACNYTHVTESRYNITHILYTLILHNNYQFYWYLNAVAIPKSSAYMYIQLYRRVQI